MIKNSNLNEESIKAMKEFKQKQIQSNIRMYMIFLIFMILVNLGLIIFIIIYKSKIKQIKSKTDKNSSTINNDKNYIINYNNEILHKVINIIANNNDWYYHHFSYLFENSKEVEIVKNSLIEFYKKQKMYYIKDKITFEVRYQSMIDGDNFNSLREKIGNIPSYQIFFLFVNDKNEKFGFYNEEIILFDKYGRYYNNGQYNHCFLLSFKTEGIFECIGNNTKLEIKNDEEGFIKIGNGDIIIKNNYLGRDKSGIINFPFKSFDDTNNNYKILTEENGEFNIRGIEIFIIHFNYYLYWNKI